MDCEIQLEMSDMTMTKAECRRCSECAGEEHHWLECFPDPCPIPGDEIDHPYLYDDWAKWLKEVDAPEAPLYLVCKHCPAWKRMPIDWGDDPPIDIDAIDEF